MSDESVNPAPGAAVPEAPPPTAGPDPWREVLEGFESLASAIGRWAKSVVDDPENRRRAQQLKEQLTDVARDLGDAADKAADKIRTAVEKKEQRPDDADAPEATPPEGDRAE
jgi:hypothetical protein